MRVWARFSCAPTPLSVDVGDFLDGPGGFSLENKLFGLGHFQLARGDVGGKSRAAGWCTWYTSQLFEGGCYSGGTTGTSGSTCGFDTTVERPHVLLRPQGDHAGVRMQRVVLSLDQSASYTLNIGHLARAIPGVRTRETTTVGGRPRGRNLCLVANRPL